MEDGTYKEAVPLVLQSILRIRLKQSLGDERSAGTNKQNWSYMIETVLF
jgi:hypothetical protein